MNPIFLLLSHLYFILSTRGICRTTAKVFLSAVPREPSPKVDHLTFRIIEDMIESHLAKMVPLSTLSTAEKECIVKQFQILNKIIHLSYYLVRTNIVKYTNKGIIDRYTEYTDHIEAVCVEYDLNLDGEKRQRNKHISFEELLGAVESYTVAQLDLRIKKEDLYVFILTFANFDYTWNSSSRPEFQALDYVLRLLIAAEEARVRINQYPSPKK